MVDLKSPTRNVSSSIMKEISSCIPLLYTILYDISLSKIRRICSSTSILNMPRLSLFLFSTECPVYLRRSHFFLLNHQVSCAFSHQDLFYYRISQASSFECLSNNFLMCSDLHFS